MQQRIVLAVLLGACLSATPVAAEPARPDAASAQSAKKTVPDSRQLEKDLQSLNWKQFRSVVEAIPPIRAEVDKYGPLGWQYVQQNYRTYPWKKPIDRLASSQKIELARLIEIARRSG